MKSKLLIFNAVLVLGVYRYGMCTQYQIPNGLAIPHSKQILASDTKVYLANVLAKQASFKNNESLLSSYIINKFRFPKGFVFKRKTHLKISL
jgi:hypothetical protein